MGAYADAFWVVAVGLVLSLTAVLLLKKPAARGGTGRGPFRLELHAVRHHRSHPHQAVPLPPVAPYTSPVT